MEAIKYKNFDELINILNQQANKLQCVGHIVGKEKLIIGDDECLSFHSWLSKYYSQLINGMESTMIANIEVYGNQNYHYDGGSIWISSTSLNSNRLLVELIRMDEEIEQSTFPLCDNPVKIGAWIIEL